MLCFIYYISNYIYIYIFFFVLIYIYIYLLQFDVFIYLSLRVFFMYLCYEGIFEDWLALGGAATRVRLQDTSHRV